MRTIEDVEKELRATRAQSGWYGMRGDDANRKDLAFKAYGLFVELENAKQQHASGWAHRLRFPGRVST